MAGFKFSPKATKALQKRKLEIRKATDADYKTRQGGRPKKKVEGGLTTYTHDYPEGEGMTVISHVDHGTVDIGRIRYNVDELKEFHGDPCEKQSKQVGGEGYNRSSGERGE